jgi:hypothetical protein
MNPFLSARLRSKKRPFQSIRPSSGYYATFKKYPSLGLLYFLFASGLPNTGFAQINLALTATASHSGGGGSSYAATNYNDNVISSCTSGCSSCSTPWGWVNGGSSSWIEYTWPTDQVFDKVVFYKADRAMSETKLQYWNGAAYVDIIDYNSTVCPVDSISFSAVTSSRLRFYGMIGASNPSFREIQVIEKLPPCTGKPVAGTATALVTTVCAGNTVTLRLSGSTLASDITYEWDSSATGAGAWAALSGGSDKSTYTYIPASGRSLYYRCRLTCTTSGEKDTSTTVIVTTTAPLTPPYSETFEGITAINTFPDCMSATRVASYVYSYLVPTGSYNQINHTPAGSKYVSFKSGSNDFLFTPALYLEAGKRYRLSFWYITDGIKGWTSLSAKIGDRAVKEAMTTTLRTESSVRNEIYKQFVTDFTVPADGTNFIGINCVAATTGDYLTIDDINLVLLPPCSTGTLTAGSKASVTPRIMCSTPGSALLTLSSLPPFSGLEYQWEESIGIPALFTPISGATTMTFTRTGISTTTYFRCKIKCGATGSFVYSDTTSVNIPPLTPPYREDFETGTEGVNMPCAGTAGGTTVWSAGSLLYWDLREGAYTSYPAVTNHTPDGNKYLYSGYNNGSYSGPAGTGDNYFWFTPGLSLSSGKSYRCSFWFSSNGSSSSPKGFKLGIYAGTAQSAAGMTLRVGNADTSVDVGSGGYRQIARSFTAPITGTYYIGIKTVHTGNNNPGVPIDDIGVEQNASCSGRPAAGIADATPTVICGTDKSTLRLSGTTEASELHYQWLQSTAGPSGPWLAAAGGAGAATADYTTPSLSAGRWYRCLVTCIVSGLSDTSTVVLVNANGIIPPYRETFESTLPGSNAPCAATSGPAFGTSSSTTNWTTKGFPYLGYAVTYDNHTPGGSNYLWAGYYLGYTSGTGTPNGAMWFTPAIKLVKDSSYEFSFWYQSPTYYYRHSAAELGMFYGTAQTEAAMTNTIRAGFIGKSDSYRQMLGRFKSNGTGNYYLGIKVKHTYSAYSYYGTAIDDIGLDQLPACTGVPVAGSVYSLPGMLCSPGTVKLDMNYENLTKASGLSYRWEWTNSDPAPGSFIPAGSSALAGDPQLTSPAISATTWFRCAVICDYTGASTYSDPVKVDVEIVTPPYLQSFEGVNQGENAPCASNTGTFSASSTSNWGVYRVPINLDYPAIYNHTPGGTAYLMGGSSLRNQYWFTPRIRLTGGKEYAFSFWYSGSGNVTGKTTLGAYYGLTNSAAGMTSAIGADIVDVNEAFYKKFEQTFTAASSGNYYLGIKINHTATATPGIAIDDIGLQEILPCSATIGAGKIMATPSHICSAGGTTTLDLEGVTLATGLAYEWLFATSPGGPYAHTGGTDRPYTTDPVTVNTWFKAVVTCTASGISDTTDAFRVRVNGLDLPYTEDFETTGKGEKPLCSEATTWGTSEINGWYVNSGSITGSYTNHTPGGKKYLQAGYYMGYTTSAPVYPTRTDDNFWFTPGFNFRAGYTYNLSFWYVASSSNSYSSRMGVFYGRAQSVGSMTNTIIPFKQFKNLNYERYDTSFTVAATGVYYLGFQESAGRFGVYNYAGVAFDDINLDYAPCNGMPFAGSISGTVTSGTPGCLNTAISLTGNDATPSLMPGIRYQWLRRPESSGAAWSAIAGATDSVLAADTLVGYEYKFGVICTNTNDTAFSNVFQLPAIPAHPPVAISPSVSPVSYCLGDTVKFNATAYTGGIYDWMVDSVVQHGWKFSDMGATEPGEYMVRVTSPLSPCPAYSNRVKLQVNDPGYTVEITKPADSIICDGDAVLLTAIASKGGVSIKWRKDNADIPFATGGSYLASMSGYYRAVAADGISLCPAVTRNVHIIVKPNPDARIAVPGGTLTACENEGVVLKANPGYSYEWMRGGSPMSGSVDDSLMVHNSGSYSVKVRTADGCMDVSTAVTVNILPSPAPVITKTILGSGSVELSTTTFLSYQWYRNGVKISGAVFQKLGLFMNGIYTVVVTGTNSCEGTSDPIEISEEGLSIGNPGVQTDQIRIYPNPTQSKVFIESPVAVQVSVKGITGKTVLQSQEVKEVDLSKYADGIYLFTISDKEGNELIRQQRVTKFTK